MKRIIRFLIFTSLMICNGIFAMKTAVIGDAAKSIVSTRADANAIVLRLQQLNTTVSQQQGIDHLIESLSQSSGQKQNKGKNDVVTTTTTTTTATPLSAGGAHASDTNLDAQIMSVIEKVNPVLMQFGKDHNIAVPDLLKYAQILQEYHIDPAGIVAFINKIQNLSSAASQDLEQHYNEMQKTDTNQYMKLMLSCVKTVEDEINGKPQVPSLLHASAIDALHQTHAAQQGTIANQKSTIFKSIVGHIAQAIVSLGFLAWSIYGQSGAGAAVVNGTMG